MPFTEAVRGIDLAVHPREIVALVGESGCGKSVTAKAIMQLIISSENVNQTGSIEFKGKNILGIPEGELNQIRGKDIGMVFQEPLSALNPLMTIGRQISEPLIFHLGMSRTEATTRSIDLLRRVQVDNPESRIRQYPHQLSGGQRQRAMIAMALACSPSLLIADEPTTALDVTIQAQILELLKELRAESELAILLITHNLGVVADISDRIYVMYSGKIVEHGKTKDVLGDPKHPYTAGLIASYPELGKTSGELVAIRGSVPDPSDIPSGCVFYPRCSMAKEKCGEKMPGLETRNQNGKGTSDQGGVACFYPLYRKI